MLKYFVVSIIAGLSVVPDLAEGKADDMENMDWKVYRDADLKVDFPAGLFPLEAEKSNIGEGRQYHSRNGRETLMIYELQNDGPWTPQSYLGHHLAIPPSRLQYKRVTNRFFAISGIKDGTTFHSRCNFSSRHIGCIYLKYPARDTALWDSVVTRISLSLRVGPDRRP